MFRPLFRLGLLATLSATILTGCVTGYSYRTDQGGDYYYAEPSIEYYDPYGMPYGTIGYGYPFGWYGHFGYGHGVYLPYSRFGFPYGYGFGFHGYPFGYPYYYRHPHRHRPPHNPPPPGVIVNPPPGGEGPRLRDEDGGPWRNLERIRRRTATPQPGDGAPPGAGARPRTAPVSLPQSTPTPRPRMDTPRAPSPARRIDPPERESRREPGP